MTLSQVPDAASNNSSRLGSHCMELALKNEFGKFVSER